MVYDAKWQLLKGTNALRSSFLHGHRISWRAASGFHQSGAASDTAESFRAILVAVEEHGWTSTRVELPLAAQCDAGTYGRLNVCVFMCACVYVCHLISKYDIIYVYLNIHIVTGRPIVRCSTISCTGGMFMIHLVTPVWPDIR